MFGRKQKRSVEIGRGPAFSYYRGQQSQVKSPRSSQNIKKHNLNWLRVLPSLTALAICLGIVLYNLYITPAAAIQAEGQNLYRPFDDYRQGIKDIMGSTIFNRSKITFNSETIEEKILETFPEISSASVAVPLVGHQPIVGIRFAEPKLRFSSAGKQMILDESGKVLPLDSVATPLPEVVDESGINYKIGDRALTREDVAAIISTNAEVTANGRKLSSIKIGTAPQEFTVQFEGESYFIKLSFEYPIRQQLGAMWAVLDRLGADKPKSYLDVRLAERVFVL